MYVYSAGLTASLSVLRSTALAQLLRPVPGAGDKERCRSEVLLFMLTSDPKQNYPIFGPTVLFLSGSVTEAGLDVDTAPSLPTICSW